MGITMNLMSLITWKDEYSVGVELIDNQHKKIFEAINELYASMKKKESQKYLEKILEKLHDYATYHFATEEGYFKKFGYEEGEKHTKEHQYYVEKVEDFQKSYEKGDVTLSFDMIDFLEDWILKHVTVTDKKYTKCFKEHGLR